MFELPDAKRVRRDEVVSPSSSTKSSPEIKPVDNEEALARLEQLLTFDISTSSTDLLSKTNDARQADSKDGNQKAEAEEEEEEEEEEFEFRLFSAPTKSTTANTATDITSDKKEKDNQIKTQKLKIRLRSPTPMDIQPGDGRFIVPFRGWRYYFTKPELLAENATRDENERARIDAEELQRRREIEDVAVTGDQVLDWARNTDTPGCHLPWRVVRLERKYHRVPKGFLREVARTTTEAAAAGEKKKSKPGKKRRIILRTRAAAKAAEQAKAEATSNMTEAEKKNKKNRERKIKRRQKEREKKAAMAAASAAGTAVGTITVDDDSSD